jgi:DNA polymerase-3 subunit delta'
MAEAEETTASGRPPVAIADYPWHREPWERITRDLARLPHALLIHGEEGLGKLTFALRLARLLLCMQPTAAREACGRCRSCQLFAAGTHPDLEIIEPPEDKEQIVIDQIRSLGEFLALKPHQAPHKVVVLHPAQAMNQNAANSLLKLLEEPPAGSVLLLVTAQPIRLPATIRSRCARLLLAPPPTGEAIGWLSAPPRSVAGAASLLALAGGAPLKALSLAQRGFLETRTSLLADLDALGSRKQSPIECATRWKTAGTREALAWLYSFAADIVRLGNGGELVNLDQRASIERFGQTIKNKELYFFLDDVSDTINQLGGPLDELLLLENLLIRWARLVQGSSRMDEAALSRT